MVLLAFVIWGAVLGGVEQRLIYAQGTAPAEASVERVDRRTFLIRLGGATAAITVGGAVVGELAEARRREAVRMAVAESMHWSTTHPLPNANAAVKAAPGTRPEFTPLERHYRIDINTIPPAADGRQWRLKVNGLVEKPLALMLEDLRRYAPSHQFVTLSCISNPLGGDLIGTTRWTGVSLRRLLPDLQLKPGATHLKIRSADQFYEVVALDAIKADERIMLAYEWDGVPLTREHGYPLRIYIPDIHGMKQPKWIESIEAIDHWEPGFWVERGWNKVAQMHATSVIDTVAVDMTIIGADASRGNWRHCACGGARNIEGRSAGGRRSVGAGGATHAAVAVDLGHLEIRLAVSVRQAHLYRPLLRWEWHTPNRDTEPAGAERGNRSAQQVNDVVRSGCYGETEKGGQGKSSGRSSNCRVRSCNHTFIVISFEKRDDFCIARKFSDAFFNLTWQNQGRLFAEQV